MRNASYGHWVVFGDLAGAFEFESAGTLRVLGDFSGAIKLGSGKPKRRGKVFLAGHTARINLKRIKGTGTVYLEHSDLPDGEHKIGDLTVFVGERRKQESSTTSENSASSDAGQSIRIQQATSSVGAWKTLRRAWQPTNDRHLN